MQLPWTRNSLSYIKISPFFFFWLNRPTVDWWMRLVLVVSDGFLQIQFPVRDSWNVVRFLLPNLSPPSLRNLLKKVVFCSFLNNTIGPIPFTQLPEISGETTAKRRSFVMMMLRQISHRNIRGPGIPPWGPYGFHQSKKLKVFNLKFEIWYYREDWGTLGKIRGITPPPQNRILLWYYQQIFSS